MKDKRCFYIPKDISFIPFKLNPGWIPQRQIETAVVMEQISKLQLPVHEAVSPCSFTHQFHPRQSRTETFQVDRSRFIDNSKLLLLWLSGLKQRFLLRS